MLVVHLALLLAVSTYARAAIADVPLYLQRIAREEYASDNKDIYIAHVHIGNPGEQGPSCVLSSRNIAPR